MKNGKRVKIIAKNNVIVDEIISVLVLNHSVNKFIDTLTLRSK